MLEYLEDGKMLTRMEALTELGIMNPTARISEMRANGVPVVTRMIGVYNRWDTKVKVAQWFIREEDKPLLFRNKRKDK
tara:strand:+ start:819 stop:1052 length:234 start_codon:yes stop_codon:yes gene_type:complete